MKDKEQGKKLDKAARALLNMQGNMSQPPKIPTKADLKRQFVIRVDSKGKPSFIEK